jgi:hypothetical protein
MKKLFIVVFVILIFLISKSPYFDLDVSRLISFVTPHVNKFESLPIKKLKIAIITAENRNDEYIKLHDQSLTEYCNIHGYHYIRLDNCQKEEATTYWCKIHKIKNVLDSNQMFDYVIWLDSDTIIVNKNIPIEYYLSKYGYPDILFGKQSIVFDLGRFTINAGIILIKNSENGNSFINDSIDKINSLDNCIINGKEQGFWASICYEEGILNLLVKSDKHKNNIFIDMDNTFILHHLNPFNQIDNNIIFLHLAGYPNDQRKKIFEYYNKG